jgi:hypothetical protein
MSSSDIQNIITGLRILNSYPEITIDSLELKYDVSAAIRHSLISEPDREALIAARWFPGIGGDENFEYQDVSYYRLDSSVPAYVAWCY